MNKPGQRIGKNEKNESNPIFVYSLASFDVED